MTNAATAVRSSRVTPTQCARPACITGRSSRSAAVFYWRRISTLKTEPRSGAPLAGSPNMKKRVKSKPAKLATQRARAVHRHSRGADPIRDFRGYGAQPPHAHWPGASRIAVNLNLNVEAGGEHCLLEGDTSSEDMLTDIGFPSCTQTRSPMVESVFEYGPRVGCWRLLRIFRRFDIKVSILAVVRGLQQYPELARAFFEEGHEIVSH